MMCTSYTMQKNRKKERENENSMDISHYLLQNTSATTMVAATHSTQLQKRQEQKRHV